MTAFVDGLCDLYDAERQLERALPTFAAAARSDTLRAALRRHLGDTHGHVETLEHIFNITGHAKRARHCDSVAGIVDEAMAILAEDPGPCASDAPLIGAARRIEQYEIGAYEALIGWARALGRDSIAELLDSILDEEKAAANQLLRLSADHPELHGVAASTRPGTDGRLTRGDRTGEAVLHSPLAGEERVHADRVSL